MPDSTRRTSITEVGAVFVPVTDQDRALTFHTEVLGFEKRAEFEYGGGLRWVEVAPVGATNSIALVPPGEGSPAPGHQTCCAFATDDIETDHADLSARGVDVDSRVAREGVSRSGLVSTDASVPDPVPAQFFFRDPDGNRFLVVQPG